MEHLDRYEGAGIDEEFVEDITDAERMAIRAAAERELEERDVLEGRGPARRSRLPTALEEELDEYRPRRRRRVDDAQAGFEDDGEEPDVAINLDEPRGPVKEFLAQDAVRREVKRQFRRFLAQHTDEAGDQVYVQRLRDMVRANACSLEVDYVDLAHRLPQVAIWVADLPNDVLPILDETALELATQEFEGYEAVARHIYVRIANIPLQESLRDLRHFHINQLVRVDGVVTRRTGMFPQLDRVMFDCVKCGAVLGPFYQAGDREIKINSCAACESKGPFTLNVRETLYRNYQKVTLQESPGNVPAGRLPRSKEVLLLNDLVDAVRPGEEVVITGVYEHGFDPSQNSKHGFPVYSTNIVANHVAKKGEAYSGARLTDEDRNEIRALARDPRIGERIIKSIAPSIYGHENIKRAIALAMFGGQEKHASSHRIRGDINVLLLGDPGTAKSQFLKYVQGCAHRAIYTTGKGASAVGLTAGVHKDPVTREWTLEGGALVLADRGLCLIDEFDKMNDQDRVSIHEAMEQQSISISKAGIVTQLQARCSVVAAANPVGGRYDSSKTFAENVELTDPILSRFDILCVIKDIVDPVNDEKLAEFVVGSHAVSHPDGDAEGAEPSTSAVDDPDVLPQDMLRKYITFAKQTVRPKLQSGDLQKITAVYADLRQESGVTHGMPIAVRHLESMVRMAESRAAMHLREFVNDDDIDAAIKCLLDSFISTQKLGVQKVLRRKFSKYIVTRGDFNSLVLFKLRECLRDARNVEQITGQMEDSTNYRIPLRQLEERCRDLDIYDLAPFLSSLEFENAGFRLDDGGATILLARA